MRKNKLSAEQQMIVNLLAKRWKLSDIRDALKAKGYPSNIGVLSQIKNGQKTASANVAAGLVDVYDDMIEA